MNYYKNGNSILSTKNKLQLPEITQAEFDAKMKDVSDKISASTLGQKLTPAEQRERAYNTQPVIAWDGEQITVTQAAQQWAYYAAEGRTDKTVKLSALIAAAKADIRAQWPDTD